MGGCIMLNSLTSKLLFMDNPHPKHLILALVVAVIFGTFSYNLETRVMDTTPTLEMGEVLGATDNLSVADMINALERQLATLQAQLAILIESKNNGQVLSEVSSSKCYVFTRSQVLGKSGDNVKELQEFLTSRPESKWPLGLGVTGYFGPATQTALQNFQCANNIVCSGTPSTTGYGKLGQQTAKVIKALSCVGNAQTDQTTS